MNKLIITTVLLTLSLSHSLTAQNVGINTTSPQTALHVASDNITTGGITIGSGTASDGGNLRLLSTANHWNLDNGGGSLRFFTETGYGTGGTVRGVFNANGNFGIGTESPTSKLEVAGDVEISGSRLHVNSNGNVGIGTSSPTERLHVNGNIRLADNSDIFGVETIEGFNVLRFKSFANGPTNLYISNDGDVGIGTTSPQTRLDVFGRLRVSDLPFGDYRNVQWNDGNHQFYYDNSSRRYKENITPLAEDFSKLLDLRPVRYTRPGSPGRWEVGFIAEEADSLGLTRLVEYDSIGRPDGFNYEKSVAYLVPILRQQQAQLARLENENAQLSTFTKEMRGEVFLLKWLLGGLLFLAVLFLFLKNRRKQPHPVFSKTGLAALLLLTVCFFQKSQAQLFIQPGATLAATGAAQITVKKMDFTNNGTFTPGSSTVMMKESGGAADLLIGGSSPTTFNNLTLDLTSRDLRLMQHITVGNNLTFTNGDLDLNGFDCDLGSSGNISGEAEGRRFYGASGEVIRTAVLNAPNAANPGNLGILLTSPEDLGTTTLRRGHTAQVTNTTSGIKRYFDIAPANNTGLGATLRLLYFDGELNGNDEAGLELWKDEGTGFVLQGFTSRDAIANFVELTGIASLSSWTLGGTGCATPTVTCYFDGDDDGFGANGSGQSFCDVCPADYVQQDGDCDDTDDSINPNGMEVCNDMDDDCDTQVDVGVTFQNYFFDNDGDGYGAGSLTSACQSPGDGYVLDNTDCDDNNDAIHPNATETCNGLDDDCDNGPDEGLTFLDYYLDNDGDTYGAGAPTYACQSPGANFVLQNGDCNDSNAAINPAATETCDAVDNNCNGQNNEGVLLTYYLDNDGDGFGNPAVSLQHCSAPTAAYVADNTDCNDSNGGIHPAATETCNGLDDNCNGYSDDNDPTLSDNQPPTVACKPFTAVLGAFGQANIQVADVMLGYTDNCFIVNFSLSRTSFSCADIGINSVKLIATDRKGNSASCTATVTVVGGPASETAAAELCNGTDDNCNGQIDEGFDQDGDGHSACGGDCNDNDPAIHPDATEWCNGIDDNCSGLADDDSDGDGVTACNGDCAPGDPLVYPGAPELCNGLDDNCNGEIDEGEITFVGNVTLTTQAQLDAWPACYTIIQGNLTIQGFDITNLGPQGNLTLQQIGLLSNGGLSNLRTVTGDVAIKFTKLANLHGLEGLTSIGRHLEIQNNGHLASLDGLQNLASIFHNLGIFQNQNLTDCCAIYSLLNGGGIGGAKSIFFNETGCDSYSEIMTDCGPSLLMRHSDGHLLDSGPAMTLSPNPASERVTVGFLGLNQEEPILLRVYDQLGRVVLVKELGPGTKDVALGPEDGLARDGIYIVRAKSSWRLLKQRLIMVK